MGVGGEGLRGRGWGGVAVRRFLGAAPAPRRVGVTEQAEGGRSSQLNDSLGSFLWGQLHQNHLGCLCRMPVPGPHPSPPSLQLLGQESAF